MTISGGKRMTRILVVAADGGKARFFEGVRLSGPLAEMNERRLDAPPTAPVSRPVRVHDRFGPARHAVESRLSPRDAAEQKFLVDVAAAIDADIDAFDRLVLCAPPRALGALRAALSQRVRARLYAEVPKDYVNEPSERLGELLSEINA